MTRYVVRRLLLAIPLVLGVATLAFLLLEFAPGDPATYMVSPGMNADVIAHIRTNFGLDQPLLVRYLKWLGSLLTGDLGYSFSTGRPVLSVVKELLPNTLLLSGCALLVSFLTGVVVGTLQAAYRGSVFDSVSNVTLLFFYSMPSFWLALMLILVFSVYAHNAWQWSVWLPVSGMTSMDYTQLAPWHRFLDRVWHLALPVLSLTLALTAAIARFMRSSMLEVIDHDYVRTARAKGLPERSVIFRHALRNALIPVVTLGGLYIPLLFSGTVFVEYVYAWPGMGRAIVQAIIAHDYPLVMGTSVLFAALVIAGNLMADVLYAVVDPRIRHE